MAGVETATPPTELKVVSPGQYWYLEKNENMDMPTVGEGIRLVKWEEGRSNSLANRNTTDSDLETYRRRDLIADAVGLMHGSLTDDSAYSMALKKVSMVERAFAGPKDPITLAARALGEQIKARRLASFEEQIKDLNIFISEDPQNIWARLLYRPSNGNSAMAKLKGFFLGSEKGEPAPQPIIVGKNGQTGRISGSFWPFGIYLEAGRK